MTNLHRYLGHFGIMMAFGVPLVAAAQSIYKCPLHGGGYQYTDMPCIGSDATVVHKATAGEVAAKVNADDQGAMLSMLRVGEVEEAKRYAVAHHQRTLYNSIVKYLMQEQVAAEQGQRQQAAIARQQRAQAVVDTMNSLSAENQNLQQQVGDQAQELELQRQTSAAAHRSARAAQDAAINAQNAARQAAMTPKYNPQTGQWCQDIGGAVECH